LTPERIHQIVPAKIRERCQKISKSEGKGRKAEEFSERTVNSLLEFLEEIEAVTVPESEYKKYLSNPLARLAKDANDDDHLIAAALHLKNKLKLKKIYILTNDNKFLGIKGLSNAGIVLVKKEYDLEDWDL